MTEREHRGAVWRGAQRASRRIGVRIGVYEALRRGLRKDVFVEGAGRGEGSVFDDYFIYLLHTHIKLIAKTMSYDYHPELAPHSTIVQPVRRAPHKLRRIIHKRLLSL